MIVGFIASYGYLDVFSAPCWKANDTDRCWLRCSSSVASLAVGCAGSFPGRLAWRYAGFSGSKMERRGVAGSFPDANSAQGQNACAVSSPRRDIHSCFSISAWFPRCQPGHAWQQPTSTGAVHGIHSARGCHMGSADFMCKLSSGCDGFLADRCRQAGCENIQRSHYFCRIGDLAVAQTSFLNADMPGTFAILHPSPVSSVSLIE
jgi:hypothetical protein